MQELTGLERKAVPQNLKNEFKSVLDFDSQTFTIVKAVHNVAAFYLLYKRNWKTLVIQLMGEEL